MGKPYIDQGTFDNALITSSSFDLFDLSSSTTSSSWDLAFTCSFGSMAILNLPRSLQNNDVSQTPMSLRGVLTAGAGARTSASAQSSHPSLPHLILLVFEAVLEVICVSLPGYIAAQQGMFDAEAQKLVANLNVTLFTPCLSKDPLPS